jgi:hypothetical protein
MRATLTGLRHGRNRMAPVESIERASTADAMSSADEESHL